MPTWADGSREPSAEELRVFFLDPEFVHFVGMLSPPRPGVLDCFITIENTHYPPDTKKNEDFILTIVVWEEIQWGVASIPAKDFPLMQGAAQANGLKIVDGIPVVFGERGPARFPIVATKMYSFENVRSHPVYKKGFSSL